MECAARKPGNVHPQASFDDLGYADFVRSAECIAPVLADAANRGVGRTILDAVIATQEAVGRNTNLGIILLLTPLAAVDESRSLTDGIAAVLDSLTHTDAEFCYEAIRRANPGGLGRAATADVAESPPGTLREMMQLAAERDAVAREYATGFEFVRKTGLPLLEEMCGGLGGDGEPRDVVPRDAPRGLCRTDTTRGLGERTTIRLHLEFLARSPDTLIARKCGWDTASEASRRAADVLNAGWPESDRGRRRFREFDDWLRGDGHRRNPGTTADLVAATLFAALRERLIPPVCDVGSKGRGKR